MSHVKLNGDEFNLNGSSLKQGNLAPDFILVNGALETITLENFKDKKKLLAIVPSVDTAVCSRESVELSKLAVSNPHVVFLVISKDLPFAQERFCKNESIKNITLLSDIRPNSNFANDYGVQIGQGPLEGLLTRAVYVLNEHDKVIHAEIVEEISEMPNLEAAIAALDKEQEQ